MKKVLSESRRNFLKSSAAATAGLAIVGPGIKKAAAADIPTKTINISQTPINTSIHNLRVAYITDATMKNGNHWGRFEDFNSTTNATSGVNYTVVKTNLDKLACALANKIYPDHVDAAWRTIFKIPSTKTWATAKAAIKVNGFAGAHPAVPIVAKVCEVLIGLGMPVANITLMEAGPYGGFMGAGKQIPNGVKTLDTRATVIAFPAPDTQKFTVANAIADADIVMSIAFNKGHDGWGWASGVTMSQKNHYWTFNNFGHTNFPMLAKANSCDFLLGNIPAAYPAKQQLCIVDNLFLGNNGSWAGDITDGNSVNTISMGVFAGALDYVSTMKIRAWKLGPGTATDGTGGWNQSIVNQFLTAYGYNLTTDGATLMAAKTKGPGAGTVDANNFTPDETGVVHDEVHLSNNGLVQVELSGNGIKPMSTSLNLAQGETVRSATIHDLRGKKIRTLNVQPGSLKVEWNGLTDGGKLAHAGTYVIQIQGQRSAIAGKVILGR
jgi:hypothetical protein